MSQGFTLQRTPPCCDLMLFHGVRMPFGKENRPVFCLWPAGQHISLDINTSRGKMHVLPQCAQVAMTPLLKVRVKIQEM